MRVLMINTVDTARNGITSVIFNCVKMLKDQGVVFDLVTKNEPDRMYVSEIEGTGGSVYVIQRSIKALPKYFLGIKKLVQSNRYDVVHIHGNSATCTIEALAARLGRARSVVVHAHSSSCVFRLAHNVLKPILNWIIDGKLACSDLAGKFLFGNHYRVFNNAIDVENYRYNENWRQEVRQRHNVPQDARVIGHVGTFTYAKNQEFLVNVLQHFRCVQQNAVLVLIGEGVKAREIREQVNRLGLDEHVIFAGTIDDVNKYMSAFDCFVFPSHFEGLGLVLLEAQASGLRCVASTGVPEAANVAGNVEYLGLDEPVDLWAEKVSFCCNTANRSEKSTEAIKKITDRGYNIAKEAYILKDFYLSVIKKDK